METVLENETSKIQWNFNIYTDQAIHHCRPNIVQIDKVDSRDANIESKYGEKVGHCKDLAIQL